MKRYLNLTATGYRYGCYPRADYKTDMLYTFYQYRDFQVVYNMATLTHTVTDRAADMLFNSGYIDENAKCTYLHHAHKMFDEINRFDNCGVEQIYGMVQQLRCEVFGAASMQRLHTDLAQSGIVKEEVTGIDQTEIKQKLLEQKESLVFLLCQPEYFATMQRDIHSAILANKKVYLVTNDREGCDLPSEALVYSWLGENVNVSILKMHSEDMAIDLRRIDDDMPLRHSIAANNALLLAYGEESLMHCRGLNLNCILHVQPTWYHTRALTNLFGRDESCVIFVPREYDLLRLVPLTERTRVTYWHLARLWRLYGDDIYDLTPTQMYRRYPQMFLNIYANTDEIVELHNEYPFHLKWQDLQNATSVENDVFLILDETKSDVVNAYLNGIEGLTYHAAWFDGQLVRKPVPWHADEQQNGILVHAFKAEKITDAQVISPKEGSTLRQYTAARQYKGVELYSNFLFFLTPKLAEQYNVLRKEHPFEHIPVQKQHLDYALYYQDDKRVETFPLFKKACIAKKSDGNFLFFNYRLGGGSMQAGDSVFYWSAADVDPVSPHSPVVVYSPYGTVSDSQSDSFIRYPVGEGRINLVVVQDKIVCVRDGTVILPSIGVVLSLDRECGTQFLVQNGLAPVQDGYYQCDGLTITLSLDPPQQISSEEWAKVEWAYGGGMSLILNGKSLFDDNAMDRWMRDEGWMSVLSCQTQESALHELVRHPRTAIGVTKEGALIVLVYSGRTKISIGANYVEMVKIARQLFPDVDCLMNVDGGGSAVLGVSVNSSFMELSYPATSFGSCAGMVRPVNTALRVSLG